jgi:hypothetical protein
MKPAGRCVQTVAIPGFSFHMTHELAGNRLRVLIPVPCSRILLSVVCSFTTSRSIVRQRRRSQLQSGNPSQSCVGDIESRFLHNGVD